MDGEITIDRYGKLTIISARGDRLVVPPNGYTMDLSLREGNLRTRFTILRHEEYGRFDVDVTSRAASISYMM